MTSTTHPTTHPADCGVTFAHDSHAYRSGRGKVKACDGSVAKRPQISRRHGDQS